MLKETLTYVDFDGVERTEDFYFNLTEAELVELDMTTPGGLRAMLKRLIGEKDPNRLVRTMKKIIGLSYGKKSDDGRKIIKNDDVLEDFRGTNAYSKLFMRLATDGDYAAKFINGIMPADLLERAEEAKKEKEKQAALPEATVTQI